MRVIALFFFFCFQFSLHSQTFILSGKITDSKGNALPFASVIVKGTTNGTNSNVDGFYTLRLKPGQHEIIFQYVGYKKEDKIINISADESLNVILQSDNYHPNH